MSRNYFIVIELTRFCNVTEIFFRLFRSLLIIILLQIILRIIKLWANEAECEKNQKYIFMPVHV